MLGELTPHLVVIQRHKHADFLARHAPLNRHIRTKEAGVGLCPKLPREHVHTLAGLDHGLEQLLRLLNLQVEDVGSRLRADLEQVSEAFGNHEDRARALHTAQRCAMCLRKVRITPTSERCF